MSTWDTFPGTWDEAAGTWDDQQGSPFDVSERRVNAACLAAFGRGIAYTPNGGGDTQMVRMIRMSPAFMEDIDPAQYIVLWARLADFTVQPTKGATVALDGNSRTVFNTRRESDGQGIYLIANRNA